MGLGAGFDQLDRDKQILAARDTAIKRKAGSTGSWRIKTVSELSPPESKQLYEKMSGYLQRKGLIDPLCLSLVNADQDRKGFLDKRTIGQVVGYNGMKISNKQLVLLTQVLVMNQDQDHSYVEMIALLAGEQKMY